MEYEKLKTIDKKTTCYIITKNVPIEYGIGELDTWRVESIGPFYFASFWQKHGSIIHTKNECLLIV